MTMILAAADIFAPVLSLLSLLQGDAGFGMSYAGLGLAGLSGVALMIWILEGEREAAAAKKRRASALPDASKRL
jgi:hypothetical protein